MATLFKKNRGIFVLVLVLLLSLSGWYLLKNRNSNKIPEKADLVLNPISLARRV